MNKEPEKSLAYETNLVMTQAGTDNAREHNIDNPHVKGIGKSIRELESI
jgi:hypothetical protein